MRIDRDGKKRYKVNLHMHTSRSDGHATPAEAAQRYLSEGYDAVAFADHWAKKLMLMVIAQRIVLKLRSFMKS